MKTYEQLTEEFGIEIPYYHLLTCKEWRDKRGEIILRDKNSCTICHKKPPDGYIPKLFFRKGGIPDMYETPVNFNFDEVMVEVYIPTIDEYIFVPQMVTEVTVVTNPIFLHVHHKYYILTKLPWEYPEDALVTVCAECHKNIHEEEKISVFKDEHMKNLIYLTPCSRCSGQGILPQYSYIHNGICFNCWGAKFNELIREVDKIRE